MAVPKKKMSRSITKRRRNNWYAMQWKKLRNCIERMKRNERGAAKVEASTTTKKKANVTKISA